MNKIETDSVYADSHTERVLINSTASRGGSKITKLKTDKKLPTPKFSVEEIEKDLLQQIKKAQQFLQEVRKTLPQPTYQGVPSLNQLKSMEEAIRRKTHIIKDIQEEIKMLKNGTYFDSKKQTDQFATIIGDIITKKQNLANVQKVYLDKVKQAQKKREMMRAVEINFQKKCKKQGIQCLTFEEFKQIEMKKKRQQRKIQKIKKPLKKQISSIKQFGFSKGQQNTIINSGNETKKMKDLLAKKNVAETALKGARRRHAVEINDLTGKLEFLRDEYHDLEEKLLLKEQELREAESKFSQSRNSSDKRLLLKRYRTQKNL